MQLKVTSAAYLFYEGYYPIMKDKEDLIKKIDVSKGLKETWKYKFSPLIEVI